MADPRMIPADDAQITLDAINHTGGHGFSFHDTYTRDLAYTVERQAAQIERVRAELVELRDRYIRREAISHERQEASADERDQFHFARFAHSHRRTHEALTRILEGGTDE